MIHFGTGGWRGIIGDDFTKANIRLLAKAMADKMKAEGLADKGIVMGYDRRFLSKETVYWSCEVFAAEGIHVWFICHSVPTPLVMYYVMENDLPYGMMVTASHNPSIYNGVKVFTAGGRDASEEQTRDIEKYIARIDPDDIPSMEYERAAAAGLVTEIYPMNDYIDYITARIDIDSIKNAHLRIGLDPMYGVGKTPLETILIMGRCELQEIHQEHDTLFGGRMPAPNAESLKLLSAYVVDRNCDLGIAVDGDGDRVGLIDDRGLYMSANDILLLLYYYLVKYKGWRGPVVRNVSTTHRLDILAEHFGEKCYEVPVGFKYISAKMAETGAILGGESSGGLAVKGTINGKDGIYAASLLIEMIAVTGRKVSELMAILTGECGEWYTVEESVRFLNEMREELIRKLYVDRELPPLDAFDVDHVSYMDGCKVYLKNGGWVIARFSGTEPLLRICSEMPREEEAEELCDLFGLFLGIS